MSVLSGGVFASGTDDLSDLRNLVDDIGQRSFDARIGNRALPDPFDATAWRHLEDAGLTRLVSTDSGGGPAEAAVVLRSLARHAVTVPVAETDLLAGWLTATAGIAVPDSGPMTVAVGDATRSGGRITATIPGVPYASSAHVVLALRDADQLLVAARDPQSLTITTGHNAGGEPRDTVTVDEPADAFIAIPDATTELTRRGAWARCMQMIGALDAAVEFSVAHTKERQQFGRPLSAFQAVQHTLAGMAGEVERARAAANLAVAVAAAADFGFDDHRTDYAVTVAKVTLGQVVPSVVTSAHQLHGAIGVTIEHQLWLATMRARSWVDEFGDTAHYAQRLGRLAMSGADPLDVIIGVATDSHG